MGLKDFFKKKAAQIAEEDKERKMRLERDIIMALRQVYDPEIPVNVYDLGLIYEVKVDDDHNVYIQMTLTAPNCRGCTRGCQREDRPCMGASLG